MIRVLLLLTAFSARPASDEDVQAKEDVLAESRYRFCHEDDYPLIDSERDFCAFVNEETSICPSLAKACKQEPKEIDDSGGSPIETKLEPGARAPTGRKSGGDDRLGVRRSKSGGNGDKGDKGDKGNGAKGNGEAGGNDGQGNGGQGNDGQGNGDGKSKSPDKPGGTEPDPTKPGDNAAKTPPTEQPKPDDPATAPPPPPPKPDPAVATAASGFARILFFVLLAGFIVFIVRMIVKNILDDSETVPDEGVPDEPSPTAPKNIQSAARGVIETDVERLLARARAAAQRGAFAQAIDDLYAALLRRLDGDGIINIQPFRTNGDYLREVRRERSEIAPDVRAILSDVESVHFGARSPSAELFSRIHDRVVPLVAKALAIAFFFVTLSATVSCGHLAANDYDDADADDNIDVPDKIDFRGDSSPSGIHAIVSLLEPVGIDMRQHRQKLDKLPDPGISTLVLLPDFDIDDIGERRLHDWVKRGGHLIFAGGSDFPAWAGAAVEFEQTSKSPARPIGIYSSQMGPIEMQIPPGTLLRCTEEDIFLARDSLCYAEQRVIENGRVFAFADDRWFMNIALPFGDNAAFLISFFSAVHHKVHVLDGQTSLGADSPIESMIRANLWPILLQLFLLLGLAFLWKGRAFGVLRDPTVERRRAFVDHVRALGLAYARSGASRHVLGIYAGWAIERLRERLPREGRRGLSGMAEALAMRMGKSTGEVMTVLVDITDVQKETAPAPFRPVVATRRAPRKDKNQAIADFALFRALDQWLALTSRERKKSPSRSSDKKPKRSS
jgi:hypothetical protein